MTFMREGWSRPQHHHTIERDREHPSFTEQFTNIEHIDVGSPNYENAEVVDVTPEHLKDGLPILFATGYRSPVQEYEPAIKTLFEKGHRVISLNYPSDNGALELTNEEARLMEKHHEYPLEDVRKAVTLLKVLSHKGVEKVNVIAHSAGAVDVAIAALLHPEKIQNIIFFCPAGLVEKGNKGRTMSGFKQHLHESKTDWLTIARQNPRQALTEGLGLVAADIHALIGQLHERGIGLFVVSGTKDPIFPAEMMRELLKEDIDNGSLDDFVEFEGGHGKNDFEGYMNVVVERIFPKITSHPSP